MKLIFLKREDGVFECQNRGLRTTDIMASIARYRTFYGKKVKINDKDYDFNGIDIKDYERVDDVKVYEIDLYIYMEIFEVKFEPKKREKLTAQGILDYFSLLYKKLNDGLEYGIENKFEYLKKIRRRLMDPFYKNGFDDNHIRNFIKRCVYFGNHKGETIYLDWLINERVLQSYFLFLKGYKPIKDIWKNLDTTISTLEKRKIKYLMNQKNFEILEDKEKIIAIKLFKIYDKRVYNDLTNKHGKKHNVNAKEEILKILCEEGSMDLDTLLRKTSHDTKYSWYEYIKEQLKEIMG